MRYIIDRFEGEFAVCEDETGAMHDFKKAQLPPNVAEGDVLQSKDGGFVIDANQTARRRADIKRKLESLWEEE